MRAVGVGSLALFATGLLLTLALPLGERSWLIWFAVLPILLATRGRGFLVGFVAGIGASLLAAWLSQGGWLYAHRSPGDSLWVYGSYAKYAFSFSMVLGLWGEPVTRRMPAWWFAAAATLLEASLLFMVPAHLALALYRQAFWVQAASVGGVWLVTFAVWWTNFALVDLLVERRASPFLLLPAVSLLLGGLWLPIGPDRQTYAAIQIAEPDEEPLLRLQRKASQEGARLVVWPEFAGIPFVRNGDTSRLRAVRGAPFVTSFPDGFRPLSHNSAALFEGGHESVHYDKRKLFGGEANMHTPGMRSVAVEGIGLNVCFDSCFPSVIRDTAHLGARVVALPTIDPRSANDFVAAMHAAFTPFRAAESGIAIVRADGVAFSIVVDARGRIFGERESGDGTLLARAADGPRFTVSKYLGDWMLWVCGLAVLVQIARARRSSVPSLRPNRTTTD